jgi:Family of unknown function (DUF6492)
MSRKYTFVTVAHQVDYDALCLQARSMTKYLNPSLIENIIVVNNGITGSINKLLDHYGPLRKYVKIFPASKLAPDYVFRASGWFVQQVLKLAVAKYVTTERYVAIDSKNTMVFPLTRDYLETFWGKPRSYRVDYTTHGSRRWLVNSLRYWHLGDNHIKLYMPIITPYTFVTSIVQDMMSEMEAREGQDFAKTFLDNKLTEFFCYAGYLLHTRQAPYHFSQKECKTVFDTTSDFAWVKRSIVATERDKLPFFSVHRGARPSEGTRHAIDGLYWRRGISR